jgi:hypothetical protein
MDLLYTFDFVFAFSNSSSDTFTAVAMITSLIVVSCKIPFRVVKRNLIIDTSEVDQGYHGVPVAGTQWRKILN